MSTYSKPDFWAIKAQKEGYPARSVYKLQEIDEKFSVIAPNSSILDLGAAPGSWSLWILKRLGPKGRLFAVDLSPLAIAPKHPGFAFLKGDIYDETVRTEILARGPYDLVVSDAAPSTTGNRMVDVARSHGLVEAAIEYADEALKPGGSLIAKIFQGGDEREILQGLKERFASARSFKPKACRAESFETFIVATGKKAP
jgi:23S rRNA (uridine2552-2'-O)-methyltransferase